MLSCKHQQQYKQQPELLEQPLAPRLTACIKLRGGGCWAQPLLQSRPSAQAVGQTNHDMGWVRHPLPLPLPLVLLLQEDVASYYAHGIHAWTCVMM